MSDPFLLAQLSDPHIGAEWAGGDPEAGLAAAVESVRSLRRQPDAILVSGDLADNGPDDEYELARELLAPLGTPLHVLPGNHDDRRGLRRHFGLPGGEAEPVQYSVRLGPMRLVVLDTTRPARTRASSTRSGSTGSMPSWPGSRMYRRCSPCIIRRSSPRSRRWTMMTAGLAGRVLMTVPSTYVQARVELGSAKTEWIVEGAGFALHAVVDGGFVSHVEPVR